MNRDNRRDVATQGWRHRDRTTPAGRGAGASRPLATRAIAALAAAALHPAAGRDQPGERAALSFDQQRQAHHLGPGHGRQDRGRAHRPRFVEVTVGDPEVADVNPLTDRSLSILGKKIGTTRVTVYGEGKGWSACSTSRCPTTSRCSPPRSARVRRRRHQGVVGQRPHHAVGHLARCPDPGPGGGHRPPVRARHHQRGAGAAAPAGDAGGAVRRGHARKPAASSASSGTPSARTRSPISAPARRRASCRSPGRAGRFNSPACTTGSRRSRTSRRPQHRHDRPLDLADRRRRRARNPGAVRLPARPP